MQGGYALTSDTSAIATLAPGFVVNSDVTSEVDTAVVDKFDKDLGHMQLILALKSITTGNASTDNLEVTVDVKHCDTSGGTYTSFETKTVLVTSPTAATVSNAVGIPLKLLGTKQFVKLGVIVAKESGATLTLTSAVASAIFLLFPQNEWPDAEYNKDGYSVPA